MSKQWVCLLHAISSHICQGCTLEMVGPSPTPSDALILGSQGSVGYAHIYPQCPTEARLSFLGLLGGGYS